MTRCRERKGRWVEFALVVTLLALAVPGCGKNVAPRTLAYDRIVLVTLDTLRADHLGTYGYLRQTAPFIDRLAERGVVFDRGYAASSTTGPAHATIFTGLYPLQHRVQKNGQGLPDPIVTLAEILAERGFQTAAFVSIRANFKSGNLDRGFATWDEPQKSAKSPYRPGEDTVAAAISWLAKCGSCEPLFLWLHLYDVHQPWQAPTRDLLAVASGAEAARADMTRFLVEEQRVPLEFYENDTEAMLRTIDEYDAEVHYADAELERFFEAFESRLQASHTLWIVTADHGEGLGNHHWMYHSKQIYDEQVRVPLIFFASDGSLQPRRVSQVVEHVDLLPTIVELSGGAQAPIRQLLPIEGRSLVPALRGDGNAPVEPQTAFMQRRHFDPRPALRHRADRERRWEPGDKYAVVEGDWKYIHRTEGDDELFDLSADPRETENLIDAMPAQAAAMRAQLLDRVETMQAGTPLEPKPADAETLELLESLGYVD